MRKWLWIGSLTVVLGSAGGYWYVNTIPAPIIADHDAQRLANVRKTVKDGDAEQSDVVEPLIVDRGDGSGVPTPAGRQDDGPMARVVLEPGVLQPPRPDAGRVPRMPFADEEEILGLSRQPLTRILEGDLAPPNIFEVLEKAMEPEQAEPQENGMPMNYHHHHHSPHCPQSGVCPAPYRVMPR